jgi:hypothetical protein
MQELHHCAVECNRLQQENLAMARDLAAHKLYVFLAQDVASTQAKEKAVVLCSRLCNFLGLIIGFSWAVGLCLLQ